MALNFNSIPAHRMPKKKEEAPKGPSVADELNTRLGMLQGRVNRCKPIKPLVKSKLTPLTHTYKLQCYCPPVTPHPCDLHYAECQHIGQIIIDRDVLTREEHICFLATPKKMPLPRQPRHSQQPRYFHKRVALPNCTARVVQLAIPDQNRVKETLRKFKGLLPDRSTKALKEQLAPKPQGAVPALSLDKALEFMEEEQRQKRVAQQVHRRRCRSLKKRILTKQRRQIRKIVCVLFEEMKEFLMNDQFIIDEHSPLCAVILERIKDFTDQDFYTTSNLREYQRILANNLTVWINKFISNLNIHLAPPQPTVTKKIMHTDEPQTFLPISDFISLSEMCEEEELEGLDYEDEFDDYLFLPEEYAGTENTIQNEGDNV